jgi:DNA-binding response OmpR family regulator
MTKILIAEDQADLREMIAATLELSGYEVNSAEDGRQAVDSAKADQPDLIILDMEMPHLTGSQVCEHLKGLAGFLHTPIVIISSHNDPVAVENGMLAGAQEYIHKPFQIDHLIERVDALLAAE